ncbi:hypothetical protein [uncultured Desulfobacter sp.]|uniref:hypothetical protein n=1 Tax=uncultured Desulfobacter sp. TaxID=240139 RepID=UPI0029F4A32C|nr:hypothetical protein [uncultured Desulfobacter sp.]
MKKMILVILLLIPLCLSQGVQAEEKIVETTGSSDLSRNDAVRQAMRSAVQEAVGTFIHTETEVENFEIKKDKIFSRTQGYVTRYDLLKEWKESDTYNVRIKAEVSLDKIKDDLMAMKILLDSMERPKLMILVEEKYVGMEDMGMRLAETELSNMFTAKGFDLVDRAQIEQIKSMDQSRQALEGNTDAAKQLGLQFGAQYVILGKAVLQDAGEAFAGSGLKSIQGTLQVKVLQTHTGLVLGSAVKNGVAAHISSLTGAAKAMKDAAQKAVDEYLVETVTNSFQDFLNNGVPLKLYITNVKSFKMYKQVAGAVQTLEKMVSSKKDGWNKTGGVLVLDLRFKGISEELADLLDGKRLDKGRLEVVDLAPDRVDCNVVQ